MENPHEQLLASSESAGAAGRFIGTTRDASADLTNVCCSFLRQSAQIPSLTPLLDTMLRSSLQAATAAARRRSAPSMPAAMLARSFSIFSSSGPGDSMSGLLRNTGLTQMEPDDTVADRSVPLGAPKPSALNRLRASGRPGAGDSAREHAVDMKMRKAMDYKMQREEAKAKAAEEAAIEAVRAARAGKK